MDSCPLVNFEVGNPLQSDLTITCANVNAKQFTVNLEIFVYENVRNKNFRIKNFRSLTPLRNY